MVYIIFVMNEIQKYLTRMEEELTKEAVSPDKKINFSKKEDLFKLLRKGATLQEIEAEIESRVGIKFKPWHHEKFAIIHQKL